MFGKNWPEGKLSGLSDKALNSTLTNKLYRTTVENRLKTNAAVSLRFMIDKASWP